MSKWKIDYWENAQGNSPVEKWLDKLTKDQFKAVYKLIEMLEDAGVDLKMPYSSPLGKDSLSCATDIMAIAYIIAFRAIV